MDNPLVPFLLRHCLAGVGAGWMTLALLLGLDVAGMGTLVLGADAWPLPLAMLAVAFAITFGSVAMGAAIMGLGRPTPPTDGRLGARVRRLVETAQVSPARSSRVRVRP